MKIRITYSCDVVVDVEIGDVAERACAEGAAPTDDQIEQLIRTDVADAACEREWPSFTIYRPDVASAVKAVRRFIAEDVDE